MKQILTLLFSSVLLLVCIIFPPLPAADLASTTAAPAAATADPEYILARAAPAAIADSEYFLTWAASAATADFQCISTSGKDTTQTECKRVWLTFDDGPTDSTTPHVLDILKENNVKATFFVIGRQLAGREDILRREATDGHAIGIHTYAHAYKKIYAGTKSLLADIEKCRTEILKILPDIKLDLYRFPGGSFGLKKCLIEAVEQAGYRHYDWNASANDAVETNATADELYKNVVTSSKGKNSVILLLHDGVGYKSTVACLPAVIDHFRKNGYQFLTL